MPAPILSLPYATVGDPQATLDFERVQAWATLVAESIDSLIVGAVPSGPAGGALSGTYPNPTIAALAVTNAMLAGSIAYSKLTLTGSIVDGDVSASAAIAQSKINGLTAALALLAPLASPALTGNPTAPTQTAGNNSTRIATTAYADAIAALKANLASPTFTGTPAAPTAAAATNTTQLATTAFVTTADNLKANLASPTFTGTPSLPTGTTGVTQTSGDSSTKLATTAFATAGDTAARMGFTFKPSVYATTIAALPAHTRSGDVLTASANGLINAAGSFGTYQFTWASGSSGTGNGQFNQPFDCAVDSSGNVFVADNAGGRIQKFNSSGVYQSQFSSGAYGIAIDSSGNIWTTENGQIRKYNSAGALQATYSTNGGYTTFNGGISIDSSNNVFVTVSNNISDYAIQKFNSSGVYQSSFGTTGTGNGQFNSPSALIHDSSNNLYVADTANHRVQKFNSSGTYQSQFGSYGTADGSMIAPAGIAIDSGGNIWVSEYFGCRIQKFNSSGTFQAKLSQQGSNNGYVTGPRGIAFSSTDDLYVADTLNNRFQKFGAFTVAAGASGGVLVKDEGSGSSLENGLYDVTSVGSAGTPWVLTRRADATNGFLASGNMVIAQRENTSQNRVFYLSTEGTITVNTTAIQWSRFEPGGPPSIHASNHAPGSSDPITEFPYGVLGISTLATSFTTSATHTTYQDEGLSTAVSYAANRVLRLTLRVHVDCPGGVQAVNFKVIRNATDIAFFQAKPDAASPESTTWVAVINGPATAATETFKVQIKAATSNTSVRSYGDASFTRQLVIEDIGPQ